MTEDSGLAAASSMFSSWRARRRFAVASFAAAVLGVRTVVGFELAVAGVGVMLLLAIAAVALTKARRQSRGVAGAHLGASALWTTGAAGTLAALATLTALAVSTGTVGTATRVLRVLRPLHAAVAHALILRHSHVAAPWPILLELLIGAAMFSTALAVRALRPARALEIGAREEALGIAQGIVADHGHDSLAPFVARPDKTFEFAAGGVLAYRVIGETAVVSGDPVGPPGAAQQLVSRLLARARAAGIEVVLYGSSAQHLDAYRRCGLRSLCAGEEAVVDPNRFTLEGRRVRKLRQSVNRIERRGWRIETREGRTIDERLEAEIDAVEAAWRSQRKRMLGFAMSMGAFDPGVRPKDLYVLARSPAGELRGVMRFLEHCGNLSLDTMRRVGETPNGLNEALVCAALRFACERGAQEVSLNYAGLGHLVRATPSGVRLRPALARVVIAVLGRHFQMDRLVAFNEKFSPTWRPRRRCTGRRTT